MIIFRRRFKLGALLILAFIIIAPLCVWAIDNTLDGAKIKKGKISDAVFWNTSDSVADIENTKVGVGTCIRNTSLSKDYLNLDGVVDFCE